MLFGTNDCFCVGFFFIYQGMKIKMEHIEYRKTELFNILIKTSQILYYIRYTNKLILYHFVDKNFHFMKNNTVLTAA